MPPAVAFVVGQDFSYGSVTRETPRSMLPADCHNIMNALIYMLIYMVFSLETNILVEKGLETGSVYSFASFTLVLIIFFQSLCRARIIE